MTEQLAGTEPARLAISPPVRYPRAVGTPEEIDTSEPARATFGSGGDRPAPSSTAARRAEQVWVPVPSSEEQAYPLRARGANLRKKYRRRHAEAETPREELAVLVDYLRSALGSADTARMRDPQAAAAVRVAIAALRDAGDTVTDRMHTWSPS